MATKKTNKGLVEYCKAQLGLPYWYGTYGQIASESLYKSKARQYEEKGYYTKWTDYPTQYGLRVHDCSGLIKGYLMSDSPTAKPVYNKAYDYSANGLLKACKEKGSINTIPEIKGVCVFYNGHVGVYIGNGEVIEARGHLYGVVKTKLSDRPWLSWGKHPMIDYGEGKTESVTGKIDTVKEVQIWLNDAYNSGLDVDGKYGKLTKAALVKALQKNLGVKVDGNYGSKTNAAVKKNNLRKGDKGELVKVLQGLLVCNGYIESYVDGSFGGGTERTVKAYQLAKGLKNDGIAGSGTFTKLCK